MNNRMMGADTPLLEKIRALSFVKTELELYLDTHPDCCAALDYYYKTVEELKDLVEEYEGTTGPLTAIGTDTTKGWSWVNEPWPWQMGNGAPNNRQGGMN
ncbi:MAG: spore coat protein CotJB [Clostridia bacterium]|nr:spore coat protein CotJB [Clostridia bacterium]